MELKLSSYFALSTFLAVGNLAHAFITYEQFYPAVMHLSGDKLSRVILYNFAFMLFLGFSLGTLRFFIGTLRDLEVEQLIDTGRAFLADTILFLVFYSPTVDGKEVDTAYLVQFICRIIFMKVFHLIVQIRVSHMFEIGVPRFWVNIKLFTLMSMLLLYDFVTLNTYYPLSTRHSTFYAWIVFEALTMAVMLIATFFKYLIHIIDLRLENGWPAKSAYLFYVDLIGDVANMTLFLIFMLSCVFQNPSRLPVYMMADVLQVARQLTMRLKAFQKYRAITANMDQKFPNATAEELEAADSCIICRDTLWEGSKKLPCSHVFHLDCLKNWVVMQQCCPTCRAEIPAHPATAPVAPAARPAPGQPGAPAPAPAAAANSAAAAGTPAASTAAASSSAAPASSAAAHGKKSAPIDPTGQATTGIPPDELLPGMGLQDIITGMKHAQSMATYMRQQQEFWMKQVEQLTLAGGSTAFSSFSSQPPGLPPTLPVRFSEMSTDEALPVVATLVPEAPSSSAASSVPKEPKSSQSSIPETVKRETAQTESIPIIQDATAQKESDGVEQEVSGELRKRTSADTVEEEIPGEMRKRTGGTDSDSKVEDDEEMRRLREMQRSKWESAKK